MHKTVLSCNLLRWVKYLKDWKIWPEHCNLVLSSGTILNWEGHGARPVLLHKQWGFWWLTNWFGFWHLTKWLHWTIFPSWLPPNKIQNSSAVDEQVTWLWIRVAKAIHTHWKFLPVDIFAKLSTNTHFSNPSPKETGSADGLLILAVNIADPWVVDFGSEYCRSVWMVEHMLWCF